MERLDAVNERARSIARIAGPALWACAWICALLLVSLVHFAFFVHWPNNLIHEDSGPYLAEARAILTGNYFEFVSHRPYGVAFFLVFLSKLLTPNILVFILVQHILSIVSAILIAASIRFAGVPRIFSILAFLIASLFARTVHYDNTVGAETISVFLTSVPVFLASGVAFRSWPAVPCAIGIGLCLGYLMMCRSAGFGAAGVVLIWFSIVASNQWIRRIGVLFLTGGIAAAVYATPAVVNSSIGKRTDSELLGVMAFPVGYSADFDHGVHLDRKAKARQYVNEKRADQTPARWAGPDLYQWPLDIIDLMREPNESRADTENMMRDIFVETMTTPSTLWHHISGHFIPEFFYLLFDVSSASRRTLDPASYESFVKRDAFPIFHSSTELKSRRLIYDHYAPPAPLSWVLPSADRVQAILDGLFSMGYAPGDPFELDRICCGINISSEYDYNAGPIRWMSAATLILLTWVIGASLGWLRPLPRNLMAAGTLMAGTALVSAAVPAFLVYGYSRYGYYVTPFMAGAIGVLAGALSERTKLVVARVTWGSPSSRLPR